MSNVDEQARALEERMRQEENLWGKVFNFNISNQPPPEIVNQLNPYNPCSERFEASILGNPNKSMKFYFLPDYVRRPECEGTIGGGMDALMESGRYLLFLRIMAPENLMWGLGLTKKLVMLEFWLKECYQTDSGKLYYQLKSETNINQFLQDSFLCTCASARHGKFVYIESSLFERCIRSPIRSMNHYKHEIENTVGID